MTHAEVIFHDVVVLKKFLGKGGWTYAPLPIKIDKNNPFGWLIVRGTIDDFALSHFKLMPKGDGTVFLPVNKKMRKAINKEAGDEVMIKLFPENRRISIPSELKVCLLDESVETFDAFLGLPESKKKTYIHKINGSRSDEAKVKHILKLIDDLRDLMKSSS